MVSVISAEQKEVRLEYKKSPKDNHGKVHRMPERIPVINVTYDTDTHQLSLESDDMTDAEVFLNDGFGNIIDYSPVLNSLFYIDSAVSSNPVITVVGNSWTATGEITL